MNKVLYDFFANDHRRIERILEEATKEKGHVDLEKYSQFRIGLLTHIKYDRRRISIRTDH